jgi:hemoglobin
MRKIIFILSIIFVYSAYSASDFEAFGGMKKINKVVQELAVKLQANEQMKPFFVESDMERFKSKLAEQFCVELGGPCKYTGKNMKRTHKGHDIKAGHFYKLVEVLQETMRENNISLRVQNKLLAKLAPMNKDVINH